MEISSKDVKHSIEDTGNSWKDESVALVHTHSLDKRIV